MIEYIEFQKMMNQKNLDDSQKVINHESHQNLNPLLICQPQEKGLISFERSQKIGSNDQCTINDFSSKQKQNVVSDFTSEDSQ